MWWPQKVNNLQLLQVTTVASKYARELGRVRKQNSVDCNLEPNDEILHTAPLKLTDAKWKTEIWKTQMPACYQCSAEKPEKAYSKESMFPSSPSL